MQNEKTSLKSELLKKHNKNQTLTKQTEVFVLIPIAMFQRTGGADVLYAVSSNEDITTVWQSVKPGGEHLLPFTWYRVVGEAKDKALRIGEFREIREQEATREEIMAVVGAYNRENSGKALEEFKGSLGAGAIVFGRGVITEVRSFGVVTLKESGKPKDVAKVNVIITDMSGNADTSLEFVASIWGDLLTVLGISTKADLEARIAGAEDGILVIKQNPKNRQNVDVVFWCPTWTKQIENGKKQKQ